MRTPVPRPLEATQPEGGRIRFGSRRPSQRERYRRNWLNRLHTMPPWMFKEAVDRLTRGMPPIAVARWIFRFSQEKRGELQGLSLQTVQRYLQVLAEVVERQKELAPASSMAEVQAEVRAALPQEPMVKVPQRKYMSVAEYVRERVGEFNRQQYLVAVVHASWETLERYRKLEEQLGDRDLPTQSFAGARAQISGKIIEACAELRKQELSDVERRKIEVALGDLGDFESGEKLSEAERVEPYASMSETDRQFTRSWLEKGRAAQRLQEQIRELQSHQSATGEPCAN